MRVGVATSLRSSVLKYCAHDVAWGFQQIGCEVGFLHEASQWCDHADEMVTQEDWVDFMDGFEPDLMLVHDVARQDVMTCRTLRKNECVWVNWVLDKFDYIFNRHAPKMLRHNDWTLGMFPQFTDELRALGYPPETTRTLLLGANTDIYNLSVEPYQERFNVDFAFVSRLSSLAGDRRDDNRRLAARLAIATNKRVGLYGGGWEKENEFAPYHKGSIEPGEELKALFHQARVVIHSNEYTNWHMRSVEATSSGANLAIVDENSETIDPPRYSHRVEYPSDLLLALERSEYEHTSQAAHRWMCDNHSYAVRAKQIIDLVGL